MYFILLPDNFVLRLYYWLQAGTASAEASSSATPVEASAKTSDLGLKPGSGEQAGPSNSASEALAAELDRVSLDEVRVLNTHPP